MTFPILGKVRHTRNIECICRRNKALRGGKRNDWRHRRSHSSNRRTFFERARVAVRTDAREARCRVALVVLYLRTPLLLNLPESGGCERTQVSPALCVAQGSLGGAGRHPMEFHEVSCRRGRDHHEIFPRGIGGGYAERWFTSSLVVGRRMFGTVWSRKRLSANVMAKPLQWVALRSHADGHGR